MPEKIIATYCPTSRQDWREWLIENHNSKQAVWLVYYKKESGTPTVSYSDAVDEALCFGWIDSTKNPLEMIPSCNFSAGENKLVFGQRLTRRRCSG